MRRFVVAYTHVSHRGAAPLRNAPQYVAVEKPDGQLEQYFDAEAALHAVVSGLIDKGVVASSIRVYELTPFRVEVEPRVVRIRTDGHEE